MTVNSLEISISADVFAWLYRTSGCTLSSVLDTIGISRERFDQYLRSHESVTLSFSDLKKLAGLYHRPITAFLIPEPPQDNTLPTDFRREPDANDYSPDLCRKFVKAQRSLRLFAEMRDELGEVPADIQQRYTIHDDPESAAEEERIRLGLNTLDVPRKADDAYNAWRDFFAARGIPVFQYNLTADGVAGFVTEWQNARGIVVNSGYRVKGRIFTIFHEYAHILLGAKAGCSDMGETSRKEEVDVVERWCDWFAGAVLMPRSLLYGNARLIKYLKDNEPIEAAKTLARIATVSNQAALVRLRVCNLVSPDAGAIEFAQWKKDVYSSNRAEVDHDDAPKKKGGPDRSKLTLSELGDSFVNLAGKSYEAGNITYSTYLETLGISKKSHDRLVMSGDIE